MEFVKGWGPSATKAPARSDLDLRPRQFVDRTKQRFIWLAAPSVVAQADVETLYIARAVLGRMATSRASIASYAMSCLTVSCFLVWPRLAG